MSLLTDSPALVPPAAAMQAALAGWRPCAVAIATYANDLSTIPSGSQEVHTDGIVVQLPDPLQDFPASRAALRRASARAAAYWAGNTYMARWILRLTEFTALFEGCELRLLARYDQIADAGPTDQQRAAVLQEFTTLIVAIQHDQALLVSAEVAYAEALPLLAQDKATLGTGVAGLAAATTAFEQTILDLILKYTLQPTTQGFAPIVQKVGQVYLDQLRRTTVSLQRVADECSQAHRAVSQLAGELLSLLGRYQGLAAALQRAEGTSFCYQLQAIKFGIARQKWQSFSAYALELLQE